MEEVLVHLRNGKTILLVDADIVVRCDPIPYLENIDSDLVFQNDSPRLFQKPGKNCTGFFLARPTRPVIGLFEETIRHMENGAANDQVALNACISSCRGLRLHRLDPLLFPNGRIWHAHRPKEAYIVHANWVRGREKKLQILKRTGFYGGGSITVVRKIYRKFWSMIGDAEYVLSSLRIRN